MNMLTKKRKASSIKQESDNKPKKIKTNNTTISNGDEQKPKEEELNKKQKKIKANDTTISNGNEEESNKKQKKLKTNDTNISNGDEQQSVNDCRQIPFKGINNNKA